MSIRIAIYSVVICASLSAFSTEPLAVTGNGGLTITVDPMGKIVACRWPSPGYNNQLAGEFVGWNFGDDLQFDIAPVAKIGSPIVTTNLVLSDDVIVKQTCFVNPTFDLLVSHIEITGSPPSEELYWDAAYTPRNNLIPELAIDSNGGFAAFSDTSTNTLYQFRPFGPGEEDFEKRDAVGNSDFWKRYVQPEQGDPAIWVGSTIIGDAVPLEIKVLRTGEGGRFTFGLEEDVDISIVSAFADSKAEVEILLNEARGIGYFTLRNTAEAHWREWLQFSSATSETEKRSLLTLKFLTDKKSGGISRSIVSTRDAVVRPEEMGWYSLALDYLGRYEDAEKIIRFHAESVRIEDSDAVPAGTLPVARYSEGAAASPAWEVSLDAAAWFISGVWRHAMFLEENERYAFLASLQVPIARSTEFLATWTEGLRGAPLHSYQSNLGRDARTKQTLLLNYMGLACGIRLHEMLEVVPEDYWMRRYNDLAALIRFSVLNQESPWVLDPRVPYWMNEVLPESDTTWKRLWEAEVNIEGKVSSLEDAFVLPEPNTMAWNARAAASSIIYSRARLE